MSKPLVIKYENRTYTFHKNTWISKDYMVVSTSLAQSLTAYAINNGLIESVITPDKEPKQITKTEEDLENDTEE